MNLLIVIPAYNEEESLVATIDELQRIAPGYDFLIVNDGSRDATRNICIEHHYTMLDLPANIGLTGGFQAGVKYALRHGYDAVIQFDADGQHMPHYIAPMIAEMEASNCDIVIGSRYVTEKKPYSARMIGSRLIAAMMRLTTGKRINDPTSGMRLFNRNALAYFDRMNDFGPEPDSIAYLMRKGLTVTEIQARMRDRSAGSSYFNIARSAEYMLRTCISILFIQWFR